MKTKNTFLVTSIGLSLFLTLNSSAKVWQVGPTRTYKAPSAVAGLVGNGDTVEIDGGTTYTGDVCSWYANDLLLKGVGNTRPVIDANGNNAQGKGTWVIGGNNNHVEFIEFTNASVPDNNGAGIRIEGNGIEIDNCYFHHNENGILGSTASTGTTKVTNSEFAYNGYGDGYTHNMYLNHCDTFIIINCYSHHAIVGHELKSRAKSNFIYYNRLMNEATGTASREVDLSNAGFTIIMGNLIQQGPQTGNSNMIGYGLEGISNPGSELSIVNNTIINERGSGGSCIMTPAIDKLILKNNIFYTGSGTLWGGSAASVDSSNNWATTNENGIGLKDFPNYDYHLTSGSAARNKGVSVGSIKGFSLIPSWEYAWPNNLTARTADATIDLGAFEYATGTGIAKTNTYKGSFLLTNINDVVTFWYDQNSDKKTLSIYDMNGRLVHESPTLNGDHYALNMDEISSGIYIVRFNTADQVITQKFIVR